MSKKLSFEASIEALEKIVEQLEKDDVTLEGSITKYKEGMILVKNCNEAIDRIEKDLTIIKDDDL